MEDKREDLIATIIIIGIVTFFIGITVFCIIFYKPQHNDGICKCGGQYEFVQAVGHKFDTSYIYKCNKCGKIIEIDEIIK